MSIDGAVIAAVRPPATGRDRRGAGAVAVTRLTLTRFRCYERARVELDRRPVVLTGPNGAGKTNLLEAVSLLAPGRGLRGAKLGELARTGAAEPGWAVAATVETETGPVEIGTGSDPAGGGERRLVQIDGKAARGQVELARHVAAVWLTPPMDRLFMEGAGGRRRFLDRLVFAFDPAHAGRLARYDRAMRERARLLRDHVGDRAWLTTLEDEMATTGVAIAAARTEAVTRLTEAAGRGIGPFPQASLALAGTPEDLVAAGPALTAEDRMREALASARAADAASGTTGVGPHRSDLAVAHRGRGVAAAQCSTGEQKALLISIVLAHARLVAAERGVAPLLLLDEVTAHLDAQRRTALFEEILALGVQAWMTGTDAALFGELGGRATHLAVADATVTPAPRPSASDGPDFGGTTGGG